MDDYFGIFKRYLWRIGTYLFKFFTRGWAFIGTVVSVIYSVIVWLKSIMIGSFALVWSYVAAYFVVTTIRRFLLFPFLVAGFIYVITYLYNDYAFAFLHNQSVRDYLTAVINQHDYLINASVFFYQIGLTQALVIYFYFIIITFVLKLFINTFKKD